nr:MAG TPA: Protein HEXIM1 T-binding domain (TBD), Cyclin.1A [Caudoviricetes sp.]
MIEELLAEIDNWRAEYIHLGREMGQIINEQQDIILKLQNENKRLKRENWNLKKTKGRKK